MVNDGFREFKEQHSFSLTSLTSPFHLEPMLAFNPDLFVRIQQVEGDRSPVPRPLDSGFSSDRLYRVMGIYTPSETAEAYFILVNDRDEFWFISQRHVRFALLKATAAHYLPLSDFSGVHDLLIGTTD